MVAWSGRRPGGPRRPHGWLFPEGVLRVAKTRPFLKWPGGKYRIAARIQAYLPAGRRLVEPFVGSAAVFLNTDYAAACLSDVNPDLINLYRAVQTEGETFVASARGLFTAEHNRADRYYAHRARFNRATDPWERALLFLYLNRHGYNGLVRYNRAGQFNVPFGRYLRPYFPEAEILAFAAAAPRASLQAQDFRAAMAAAAPGDVVYCDPPYLPLSATANFRDYAGGGFTVQDQAELADRARMLAARGIPVLVSNHDTPESLALYAGARVERFAVRRSISRDGQRRGAAQELLALFLPAHAAAGRPNS